VLRAGGRLYLECMRRVLQLEGEAIEAGRPPVCRAFRSGPAAGSSRRSSTTRTGGGRTASSTRSSSGSGRVCRRRSSRRARPATAPDCGSPVRRGRGMGRLTAEGARAATAPAAAHDRRAGRRGGPVRPAVPLFYRRATWLPEDEFRAASPGKWRRRGWSWPRSCGAARVGVGPHVPLAHRANKSKAWLRSRGNPEC